MQKRYETKENDGVLPGGHVLGQFIGSLLFCWFYFTGPRGKFKFAV